MNKFCQYCNKECSKYGLKAHENVCKDNPNKQRFYCQYCNKECSKYGVKNHEKSCSLNPNQDLSRINKGILTKQIRGTCGSNQYSRARTTGIPYITTEETRKKLRENIRIRLERDPDFMKKVGRKTSKTCLEKSKNGDWHVSLPSKMHKNYKGIDLHGNWELAYAIYLDRNNIRWERVKMGFFQYIIDDKYHTYTPDFYLIDEDIYVEIKGYKVLKDDIKWEQFSKVYNFRVYREKDLKKLFSEHKDLLKLCKF